MSRIDRVFEEYRAAAMRSPVTRANQPIMPKLEAPGGLPMALSVNL